MRRGANLVFPAGCACHMGRPPGSPHTRHFTVARSAQSTCPNSRRRALQVSSSWDMLGSRSRQPRLQKELPGGQGPLKSHRLTIARSTSPAPPHPLASYLPPHMAPLPNAIHHPRRKPIPSSGAQQLALLDMAALQAGKQAPGVRRFSSTCARARSCTQQSLACACQHAAIIIIITRVCSQYAAGRRPGLNKCRRRMRNAGTAGVRRQDGREGATHTRPRPDSGATVHAKQRPLQFLPNTMRTGPLVGPCRARALEFEAPHPVVSNLGAGAAWRSIGNGPS